jgi:hypothetical protein
MIRGYMAIVLLAVLGSVALPAAAAEDLIYWTDASPGDSLLFRADLDGSTTPLGVSVPAGVYHVLLRVGGQSSVARVVLLD